MKSDKQIADALDGKQIENLKFNKATIGVGKIKYYLSIYTFPQNEDEYLNEEISFSPKKLVRFCKEVLKIIGEKEK